MAKIANKISLTILFVFFIQSAFTQSVLTKRVSLQLQNQKVEQALLEVERKAEIQFSYNPDHFNVDSVISIECYNLSIKDVLVQILGEYIELKVVGSTTVIIRSSRGTREVKKYKYDITGIIYDSYSGQKLSEVTVYQVDGVRSAQSKGDGSYSIKVVSNKEFIELTYSKKDYVDEVIIIKPSENQTFEVGLEPSRIEPVTPKEIDDIHPVEGRNIDSSRFVKVVVPKRQRWLIENIPFLSEPQPVQISLLPSVGTNQQMNAVMENKVSINIIAGYSRAVEGVELGGLLNIVREDVSGGQLAGFGNLVGGNVIGLQAAGFFNNTKGKLNGAQFAGFSNLAIDSVKGGQFAGFMNISNKYIDGGQFGGYLNIAGESMNGFQASGFVNVVKDTMTGVQIAGFGNYATQVNGYQISGFINIAKKVKGVQLGIVNVADSVQGATIGIFNFVRHGYHPLEVSVTDYGTTSLRWKTGTRGFYNILEAGINYTDQSYWHYNYGFGHSLRLKEDKTYLDFELTSGVINPSNGFNKKFNLINKLEILFSYRIIGPVYIFAGPTVNGYLYENDFDVPFSRPFNTFNTQYFSNLKLDNYLGYRFGLRI